MCGIFGLAIPESAEVPKKNVIKDTVRLFRLSETRGKEASGLTILPDTKSDSIFVVKSPCSASELLKEKSFQTFLDKTFESPGAFVRGSVAIGHTRLVTNGSQLDQNNNQPVLNEHAILIHNGIILNAEELWAKHGDLSRKGNVDSEVLVALVRKYYLENNNPILSVQKVFAEVEGTASIAMIFSDLNILILATNNGSLYYSQKSNVSPFYFASEKYILSKMSGKDPFVEQVLANQGLVIDLRSGDSKEFQLSETPSNVQWSSEVEKLRIVNIENIGTAKMNSLVSPIKNSVPKDLELFYQKVTDFNGSLRRCVKCVLPQTVPFIEFDQRGVCNFCRNYQPIQLRSETELETLLSQHRKQNGKPDCVAALSGGRDSCYGLHVMVNQLGLRPITYTYDWGMVTDLARRNISRMCSRLGIENIIISADIARKRKNIRKNVSAWLEKPHLGMVPLFMAGDKQFIWYAQKIKKQNQIGLDIFTFNLLEKTQFKEEYTGIQMWKPGADSNKLGEHLGLWPKIRLASFYGKEYLSNPSYLNSSLLDTFYGYLAYYFLPQTFVPLFNYLPWREAEIDRVLIEDYDWEVATDTKTTWRIGDGTAPFYNYIYYVMGGFSENDTIRSNQVREGHMDRETALKLTYRDNSARWESIQWYCETIGIDFHTTIKRINSFALMEQPLKLQLIERT